MCSPVDSPGTFFFYVPALARCVSYVAGAPKRKEKLLLVSPAELGAIHLFLLILISIKVQSNIDIPFGFDSGNDILRYGRRGREKSV